MAEENVNELLGIEDTSHVLENSFSRKKSVTQNNAAENTLNVIATIVLWVEIISALLCLFFLTTKEEMDTNYYYSIHYTTVFNPVGIYMSIGVLLSTLTTWSLLKVIVNISKTLKEINSKLK